jgi:glycosyltransferase involved in cell wall biosynthesis
MRPRVLVLTSTFPRWSGDSEPRFVLDLCRHLAGDAEVRVLAPHTRGAAFEEILEGVEVRRFRYFFTRYQSLAYAGGIMARLRANPLRLLLLPFFVLAFAHAVRSATRAWRPDVIHAHWIIPQGLVAALAGPSGLPVICTSHGGDLQALRGPAFATLKAWILRRCRYVTVVSDSMVPKVLALVPECPVEVIPMGTDLTTLFTPSANPGGRHGRDLLFVGRLVEKKGVRYLLEALAVLARTYPDLKLTIAGDGPLRGDLECQAADLGIDARVEFLGGVAHSSLPDLYRRATLAVFPFVVAADGDQEGFGLVVVEAMGCGCPVIAGDLPAVRSSIEPGVTAVLVPPADVTALATAIASQLENPARRINYAAAALARVRDRFDWSCIATRYRCVIDRVLEGA